MKKAVYDASTGKIELVDISDPLSFTLLQEAMLTSLMDMYKATIVQGFTSSATGTAIEYGYQSQDQLNYSKWANYLALDSTKTSVTIGTVNAGVVTMTRAQFLQFVNDAEAYEMGLYNQRITLENQIKSATTVDELNAITLAF
jgi:hypothetical protein